MIISIYERAPGKHTGIYIHGDLTDDLPPSIRYRKYKSGEVINISLGNSFKYHAAHGLNVLVDQLTGIINTAEETLHRHEQSS